MMKMQGFNSLYFSFSWVLIISSSPPFVLQYYLFFSITNYPNSLVSTWSWSCLKVSMGFTPRLFTYLQFNRVCSQANKISNSGISPVPAMVEADTTRSSSTGLDRVVPVSTEILNPDLNSMCSSRLILLNETKGPHFL